MPSLASSMTDRGHEPTHPGAILRDDVLPALGLPVSTAARTLGVSRQMLHAILSERASITPEMALRVGEMALRVGKMCGNGPGLWLRMQQARDLWRAERAIAAEVAAIPTLRAA